MFVLTSFLGVFASCKDGAKPDVSSRMYLLTWIVLGGGFGCHESVHCVLAKFRLYNVRKKCPVKAPWWFEILNSITFVCIPVHDRCSSPCFSNFVFIWEKLQHMKSSLLLPLGSTRSSYKWSDCPHRGSCWTLNRVWSCAGSSACPSKLLPSSILKSRLPLCLSHEINEIFLYALMHCQLWGKSSSFVVQCTLSYEGVLFLSAVGEIFQDGHVCAVVKTRIFLCRNEQMMIPRSRKPSKNC